MNSPAFAAGKKKAGAILYLSFEQLKESAVMPALILKPGFFRIRPLVDKG